MTILPSGFKFNKKTKRATVQIQFDKEMSDALIFFASLYECKEPELVHDVTVEWLKTAVEEELKKKKAGEKSGEIKT